MRRLGNKMVKENQFRNRNFMTKHIEVYYSFLRLALKQNKEYKINLVMGFLANVTVTLAYFLFYFVYTNISNEFLGWKFYDFALMLLILLTASLGLRMFCIFLFQRTLLTGTMNLYLIRPVNPFFMSLSKFTGSIVFYTTLWFLISIIFVLIGNYQNYLLALLCFVIGFVGHVLIINNILSLSFFMKENDFLLTLYYHEFVNTIESFTPKVFENLFFGNVLYLVPISFVGYFVIEILKGNTTQFYIYLPWFIGVIFVSFIVLIIQWHYGLKRYEAYG